MDNVPKSPTQGSVSLREWDTGFPESICGRRNTSLPHPDARIGPDACIGEDDIAATRALARHRMSLLVGRERSRLITTSMVGSEAEHVFASPVLMDDCDNVSTIGRLALGSLGGLDSSRRDGSMSSKDIDSLASVSGGSTGSTSPMHPPGGMSSPRQRESRRRSFIRRLTRR